MPRVKIWRARLGSTRRSGRTKCTDLAGLAKNLEDIRERVAAAAARCGRRADEITLVAVTKTFPAEAIRAAYELGVRHFGENRVQEFESKERGLDCPEATWHLIGHLQGNKARRAAQLFIASIRWIAWRWPRNSIG